MANTQTLASVKTLDTTAWIYEKHACLQSFRTDVVLAVYHFQYCSTCIPLSSDSLFYSIVITICFWVLFDLISNLSDSPIQPLMYFGPPLLSEQFIYLNNPTLPTRQNVGCIKVCFMQYARDFGCLSNSEWDDFLSAPKKKSDYPLI